MDKLYNRINFENSPSINTPLSAANLNKMDKAIDDLDDRVIEMSEGLEERIKSGVMDGEDGATFTPSVSEDGTLSWSNDKGLKNPSDVNIKGEKGSNGNDGKDGTSVTHEWNGTILSVTSASGTSSVDLKGPKGDKGETGETGPQGERGATGAKGDTGEKGEKGDNGINGNDGKDGISATHSWNGTVLTITSASGTTSANLKGEQGIAGEKGADGTSVSIHRTSESEKDGGNNVVVFSDGTYLNIKNGSKGDKGDKGDPGVGINLDVTGATQGQMLIVAGVDENGVPTSWAAVDRTHWDDSYNSKILPETSYPKEYVISESFGRTLDMENLIPGETYRVMWNKTEYIFEAKQMVIGSVTCCYIGNAAIPYKKEDTGEPFSIISTENSGDLFEGTSYLSTEIPDDEKDALPDTVTISVEHIVISSQKLDEKYLPDSVATKEYVNNAVKNVSGGSGSSVTSWNDLKDRPFYEEGEVVHKLDNKYLDLGWLPTSNEVMSEILAENTYTIKAIDSYSANMTLNLIDGNTYIVNFNNKEYEVVAYSVYYADTFKLTILGDASIAFGELAKPTGEPFFVLEGGEDAVQAGLIHKTVLIRPLEKEAGEEYEFTISIFEKRGDVNKIPRKFLPEGYPYTEKLKMVEILPETEAILVDEGTFAVMENVPDLVIGDTYVVKYNGVEYECVGQDASAMTPEAVLLGDGSLFGGSTNGEPFAVIEAEEGSMRMLMIAPIDNASSVTISIKGNGEVVHKIDEKYLPNLPVIVSMKSINLETGEIIMTHTASEIKKLSYDGKLIFMVCDGIPFISTGSFGMDGDGNVISVDFTQVIDPTKTATVDNNGKFATNY